MAQQCLKEYSFLVIISGHKLAGGQEPGSRNASHSSFNRAPPSAMWWSGQGKDALFPPHPSPLSRSPHHPPSLPSAGACKGVRTADPKAAGSPQHRTMTGYPKGVPVRSHYQWWSTNQTPQTRQMTHCNEHSQVKMSGLKGILCDSLSHCSFHEEIRGQGCCKGRDKGEGRFNGIGMLDMKSTKKSIKKFFKM